jgi:alkylhydroperoxidase/carboxymuconolactone decarboxylase family protein YurZ
MAEHPLAHYRELDPEAVDLIQQLNNFALGDGELPRKVKILIAMALDASHGAVNGVKSLAVQAMAEGATKGEIAETLRVAMYVSGVGSVFSAAAGLRELDL